jgi:hypothetical protein
MSHLGREFRIPQRSRFGREEFTFETRKLCQMCLKFGKRSQFQPQIAEVKTSPTSRKDGLIG